VAADDLPAGAALLGLARDVLLQDLLPLLPPERHLDARLVANCMAIADREAADGAAPSQDILRRLREFYDAGDDAGDAADLPARFARDLRMGAFEISPEREAGARAILWQITMARLRHANPRFLAANGLA
jgi:hypothetical protein